MISIEVPGTVNNPEAVIDALGGVNRVAEVVESNNDHTLTMKIMADDIYSKSVFAKRERAAGILMRVRTYEDGRRCVLVEGIIDCQYTFNSLADYACALPDICRLPRNQVGELEAARNGTISPLKTCSTGLVKQNLSDPMTEVEGNSKLTGGNPQEWTGVVDGGLAVYVPPTYSRHINPFPYRYQDNLFTNNVKYFLLDVPAEERKLNQDVFNLNLLDGGEQVGEFQFMPVERGRDGPYNQVARYSDEKYPCNMPPQLRLVTVDEKLMKSTLDNFAARPLWQRTTLLDSIDEHVTLWRIKPVLAKTCFLFQDGPWRACLCRNGYDPRKDSESRKYQTIDFRDPYFRSVGWKTQQVSKESTQYSNRKIKHDWNFREPPTKPSQFYQLCDIDDNIVQELIRISPVLPECNRLTGEKDH